MIWVLIGAALALLGIAGVGVYAWTLIGKGKDVVAEVAVLRDRIAQGRELTRAVQLPHRSRD